jgi:integrase/recombinase XerD
VVDPSRARVTGPLAPFAQGYVVALAKEGRSAHGSVKQMHLFAHLSRWLDGEGLGPADLDRGVVERFFVSRRASGQRKLVTPMAAGSLLAFLREAGLTPPESEPLAQGPVEELLAVFRRYLLLERGVLEETARDYARSVQPFLEGLEGPDGIEFERLNGPAVVAFVAERCPGRSRSSAKRTTKALRSLLGFLHVEGYLDRSLVHAVPTAAGWRLSGLPRRLEPGQVRRLLAACDTGTPAGRRDRAVLTLLARLGLRACEIVALSLDDIDWRAGELVVHGKHSRVDRLPLPVDVGETSVAWLKDGRPATASCRAVFVRVRAPHRALSRAAVGKIAVDAAERAGLPRVGAHPLRHTLASEMLRAGVSLEQIGQVLRHSHPETTAIYAKIDRDGLRRIARPWPGATR